MPRVKSPRTKEAQRTDPIALVGDTALPVETDAQLDPLLEAIGEARFVLLGEATHGTHEFYRIRAELTRRLIVEHGFNAVAVEADWPDAYRVNRFVRGLGRDRTPTEALRDFRRFPSWMWRNGDVVDFVSWLRAHNNALRAQERVGFYGLDLYSLHASAAAVIDYLQRVDPAAADRARRRYGCFDHVGADADESWPRSYGMEALLGARRSCEPEVIEQLVDLRRVAAEAVARDGLAAEDERFCAEQNARVVRNAEEYYREAFRGRVNTWNLRDRHMAATLDDLADHLAQQGEGPARIVVWEHNSHVGDARASDREAQGELNVGQLARERYGEGAFLVGFTTHHGAVTAASEWGGPAERKRVRPALPTSIEALLHEVAHERRLRAFGVLLRDADPALRRALESPRLERAIGVVYLPRSERLSHYFYCQVSRQFDALIHVDETTAVIPLERTAEWDRGELPETFPTGL